MVNLVLVCLEMVLVSMQDRCMGCAKHTIGLEIVLEEDVELLGEVTHGIMFGPFHDGVGVSARQVHGLRQTYHRLRNHLGRTQ
jgi:hypothetical protein